MFVRIVCFFILWGITSSYAIDSGERVFLDNFQIVLNRVIVCFEDDSRYQKVDLTISGHKITVERQNNQEYVFEQPLQIDPNKNLRIEYELFPGDAAFGIKMIDKNSFKSRAHYDLKVNIGDCCVYGVKTTLVKK